MSLFWSIALGLAALIGAAALIEAVLKRNHSRPLVRSRPEADDIERSLMRQKSGEVDATGNRSYLASIAKQEAETERRLRQKHSDARADRPQQENRD